MGECRSKYEILCSHPYRYRFSFFGGGGGSRTPLCRILVLWTLRAVSAEKGLHNIESMCHICMLQICAYTDRQSVYHPFQNHYTQKIIIFKLFRSLQLQFSGLTGINFRYSYSFVGLTGICLYSYSSVQLHKKGLRNYFPKITVTVT